jgi:prophage tail gpP-like protein
MFSPNNPAILTPDAPDTTSQPDATVNTYTVPVRSPDSTDSQEQATLIVGGTNFKDWESVFVQLRWGDPFAYFRFTSVERDAPSSNAAPVTTTQWYQDPQFMPGTPCEINLGGVPVIKGYIEVRQVAYDANRHGIELQGKSWTAPVARSSVNTGTGSFDGLTWKQVADKVVAPYGVQVIPIGTLNSIPFDKLQNQPGELIWDFLERIARPRGIILGSDSFGNFLAIGDHSMPVLNTQLIEGQNIKAMQCIFTKEHVYAEYDVTAQSAASNDNAFTAASELRGSWGGSGYKGSILITPSEQPVKTVQEVIDRAKNEALWHEGPQIEATVTVQGWFRDEVTLWWPGDNVFVYSPMCPLNMLMKIQNVTFTQDNNAGTQTQLYLKQPWALKQQAFMNPEAPNSTATPAPQAVQQEIQPTP